MIRGWYHKLMKSDPIKTVLRTVHRLRAPGGCPWDRKQTHQSLRPFLIEEAYEVLEILDHLRSRQQLRDPKQTGKFKEELGDLLLQILLHSEIASESRAFDFGDVANALNDKLVRRHPHVFGKVKVRGATQVLKNWEVIKQAEKKDAGEKRQGVLDGLPRSLPALQRTTRAINKVSRVGFQWPSLKGPIAKLHEELREFEAALKRGTREQQFEELGDFLFNVCNIAFFLKLDPENALRASLAKFERRFRGVETRLAKRGKKPQESNLREMDQIWNAVKAEEKRKKRRGR